MTTLTAEANDTCQVAEGTSGGMVKCAEPAVATVTDSIKSYRVCAEHARQMERTAGSHTMKWEWRGKDSKISGTG